MVGGGAISSYAIRGVVEAAKDLDVLVSFKVTALERSLIRRRARIWSAATGIREFFEAIFTRLATMRSETAVSLAAQTGVVE